MSSKFSKIFLIAFFLGTSILVTGCGSNSSNDSIVTDSTGGDDNTGGSGGNTGGGTGGDTGGDGAVDTNNNTVAEGVTGPLDAVQTPLSEQVFGQLVGAASGTPLEGTLDCAGQAVVIDIIDVLDSIALALTTAAETQDPAAAFDSAAANIQFSAEELAKDLPGALTALAGDDCNGGSDDGGDGSAGSDNPLAGTPLAPLGDALAPVLSQFPTGGGEEGEDLDLQSLSALFHQLSLAFRSGLAQIPAEAATAPVFGGLLTTLDTAFADLDVTLLNLGVYDGEMTAEALEVTLNHLLINVLTEVVPVNFFEAQAGQVGTFSGPITDGVNQLTAALGDNLLDAALPPLTDALDNPLAVLLDPIENTLLPALLGPITDGIASALGGGGTGGDAGGPTGTPLDLLLGPITDALGGGLGGGGGDGPTGTPLDIILGPLLAAGGGTGGACPFAGTPLEPACAIFEAVPAP